ncbi:bifunctional phosphoglucose/phosphomannose isomerase [bacterium]|nr:bifunctional phosphoglucose/phosphomannose isomerase [bacterium]
MKYPDEQVKILDRSYMLKDLLNFHKQFSSGLRLGGALDPGMINLNSISNLILCGMGGSAIGGDLLRSYLTDQIPIPLTVNREYTIPGWVNARTLAIISSYSGNTEETLSALSAAQLKKARIICLTTGGKLLSVARENNYPTLILPGGLPPRSALGYSFASLMGIFYRLNMISDPTEFDETTSYLEKEAQNLGNGVPAPENKAKMLALRLYKKIPSFLAPVRWLEAVALRFQGQLEENAKTLAFHSLIPEMCHNDLVGWAHLGELKKLLQPIFLIDRGLEPRLINRILCTKRIFSDNGLEPITLETRGESLLTRIFSLIQLADFTSFYLAILNGQDPTPIAVLDKLKETLSQFDSKEVI